MVRLTAERRVMEKEIHGAERGSGLIESRRAKTASSRRKDEAHCQRAERMVCVTQQAGRK